MKVFVAGATGALGSQLVPRLVANGHDVTGMTRTESKRDLVRSLGARPAVADGLDPDAVAQAVAEAEPEVIVHELTGLSGSFDMRHMDRTFALTNRLRTEGTDHLLAAGRAVGARRFVAQSFAGYTFDHDPPEQLRGLLDAIRYLEDAVTGIDWGEGIVLRYGGFYGPGTSLSADPQADFTAPIRKRRFPVVGSGNGVWSFIHIEDAASATVAAVEHGAPGIYQVTDDEPAPVREWLPVLARALRAKPPRHVPKWLGRLLAGEAATVMMTEVHGASNEKAKRELGWQPHYASWRQGFAEGLG
jgi:nucleoside-diphosphate-sugar epimerase